MTAPQDLGPARAAFARRASTLLKPMYRGPVGGRFPGGAYAGGMRQVSPPAAGT